MDGWMNRKSYTLRDSGRLTIDSFSMRVCVCVFSLDSVHKTRQNPQTVLKGGFLFQCQMQWHQPRELDPFS